LEQIANISLNDLVFIDESGIDSFLYRPYGRSKKGQEVFGNVSGKRFYRESFIAAKCKSNILAPFCFQGTCNTQLFEFWIEKFLLPELKPHQIVIMDNATFHKSKKTQALIEQAQCKLLFLPAYSPDLNPIEKFWAWFKTKVRSCIDQFSTLSQAIDYVFNL
jgi:transposase